MSRLFPSSRAARLRLILFLALAAVIGYYGHIEAYYFYARYSPREGDIIFQSLPHGNLVDAIEGITHSPYSHCGVVLRDEKNRWVVIEALSYVHETPLLLWILRGRESRFTVYRLDPKYDASIPAFKRNLHAYDGCLYDFDYEMSDDEIYCSELVYKGFQKTTGEQMGTLEKLGSLDWKPFQAFIKTEQNGRLPLDRMMITPASLARAPQIKEVYRGGF